MYQHRQTGTFNTGLGHQYSTHTGGDRYSPDEMAYQRGQMLASNDSRLRHLMQTQYHDYRGKNPADSGPAAGRDQMVRDYFALANNYLRKGNVGMYDAIVDDLNRRMKYFHHLTQGTGEGYGSEEGTRMDPMANRPGDPMDKAWRGNVYYNDIVAGPGGPSQFRSDSYRDQLMADPRRQQRLQESLNGQQYGVNWTGNQRHRTDPFGPSVAKNLQIHGDGRYNEKYGYSLNDGTQSIDELARDTIR